MAIILENLNLADAERKLCEEALRRAGSIVDAAAILGITRHALKRRIVKYEIDWPGVPIGGSHKATGRTLAAC